MIKYELVEKCLKDIRAKKMLRIDRDVFLRNDCQIMLDKINESHKDAITESVRLVGNNKIISVDIPSRAYYVEDIGRLSIQNLSSAERMFCIAEIAKITGEKVCFLYSVKELQSNTLRKFLSRYMNCDNIIIGVQDDTGESDRLDILIKEMTA